LKATIIAATITERMILYNNTNKYFEKGISEFSFELFKVFGKAMVVVGENVKVEKQITWSKLFIDYKHWKLGT